MGFDVGGEVAADDLRARMLRVMDELPVLAGRLRFSPVFARPAWRVDKAAESIQGVYQFEDLSAAKDAVVAADAAMEAAASGSIDLATPPIVRLHHIRTRAFDRVLLTWPHPLMDGQGGYEVLRRLSGVASGDGLSRVDATVATREIQMSLIARLSRAIRGYRAQRAVSRILTKPPLTGPVDSSGRIRFARRLDKPDTFAVVASAAKRLTPPGPGLYARHLAACTIRALRRLYEKHGWTTPNYAISFPMRPGGLAASAQPLGNHLVAAALHVPHEIALDWSRLGDAIAGQVAAFSATGGDLDQWALLWASSLMRPGQYHAMMKSSVAMTPIISGYSYFQAEDANPIGQFMNFPIARNVFGGVVTIPPGWNPAFWRHGSRLTMTLAWPAGFIADELAVEFADLIESEALGAV